MTSHVEQINLSCMLCAPEKVKQILFNIYQMLLLLLVTMLSPSEPVSALRSLQFCEVDSPAKLSLEFNRLSAMMGYIKHYDGLSIR